MRKQILIFFILLSLNLWAERGLSHYINSQLLVKDSEEAGDRLVEWCELNGGYYINRTQDYILFRLPNDYVNDLKPFLESITEELVEFSKNSTNLNPRVSELKSGIKAREDILDQNLYYLESSDIEGTLTLEIEIRRLRDEVDNYKGELRKLENDLDMATISIDITFRSRSINNWEYSAFQWVNLIDFYNLINHSISQDTLGMFGPKPTIPDGFALVQKSPLLRAISPEGGLFVVSNYKNYPEQRNKIIM